MTEEDVSYEIIPVTPIRKLEERMEKIESSGSTPQLQNLINQIIELIRNNQKIVNDVIQANNDLRNELSKLPSKMDELIDTINGFLELVEAAGKEEVNAMPQPAQPNADAFKPIIDELKKISDQNQKLVESNQVVLDELNKMDRKLKGGMPVSTLLSNYPLKKEVKRFEQL
jgi:soluble cytochrome b562